MIHILISGEVQGVGFRQFVKYNAKKLNLKGWVMNLPDGKVEGMLIGDRQNLNTMIEICHKGPFLAKVNDVKIEEIPDENFDSFEVIKD